MTASPAPGWAIARADLGADGEVIAADRRFRQLLRAPDDLAIVGRRWSSLVSDRSGDALRLALRRLQREERWGGALEMRIDDGAQPLRVDAYPAYGGEHRMVVLRAVELSARPRGVEPATRLAILEANVALPEPRAAAFATLQELRHQIDFDWGVVLAFLPDGRAEVAAAYPSAMAGATTGTAFVPDFPERILAESGEPSIAGEIDADRLARSPLGRLPGFGMRSVIRVPLFGVGRVAGCVNLYAHAPAAFDALDGLALEQYVRPLGDRVAQIGGAAAAPTAGGTSASPGAAPAPAFAAPAVREVQAAAAPAVVPHPERPPQPSTADASGAPLPGDILAAAEEPGPSGGSASGGSAAGGGAASGDAAGEGAEAEAQQREGLTQLGSLVSGVAHELNNPLTAILGYAQMLPSLGAEDASRAIRTIEQEAIRAGRIVRNLLYFARQHRPRVDEVDLAALLRRVIEVRRYHFAVDNVEIHHELGPLPPIVGDQYQLEQVFLNLLNNAHQALRPQGGVITVGAEVVDGSARVSISDTGPGIPEGLRTRIFEPFFTTREVGEGSGLGLSIAYGIVQEHNGRLWAEPAAGGGARLVVELPLAERDVQQPPASRPPAPTTGTPRGAVLVVDDEEPIRALLAEILSQHGYPVIAAANTQEALRLLATQPVELVLCDVRMPGGSGYELRERLQATHPHLAERFLFVTGDVERDRRNQPAAAGAHFLEKPFTTEQLLGALARVGAPSTPGAPSIPGTPGAPAPDTSAGEPG